MNTKTVALEAITEAVNILYTLSQIDFDERWVTADCAYLTRLDRLAQALGFPDALTAQKQVEGDREHEDNKYRDMDPGLF